MNRPGSLADDSGNYTLPFEQYILEFCDGQETKQVVDRPAAASHRRFRPDALSHRQGNGHQRERLGAVLQRASRAFDESPERPRRVPATQNHAGAQARQERKMKLWRASLAIRAAGNEYSL